MDTIDIILTEIRSLRQEVAALRFAKPQRPERPDDMLTLDEATVIWRKTKRSLIEAIKAAEADDSAPVIKRCYGRIERASLEALIDWRLRRKVSLKEHVQTNFQRSKRMSAR